VHGEKVHGARQGDVQTVYPLPFTLCPLLRPDAYARRPTFFFYFQFHIPFRIFAARFKKTGYAEENI
jgi:hypothetical protein